MTYYLHDPEIMSNYYFIKCVCNAVIILRYHTLCTSSSDEFHDLKTDICIMKVSKPTINIHYQI